MKSDFEQRKANRIARYQELAAKNEKKAEEQHSRAKEMASIIPFGQPILVGHHSKTRDWNYRKKISNLFGKSFESDQKAKYYENKAEVTASHDAISSDDPKAVEKLRKKLNDMEQLQSFMKAANKIVRRKTMTEIEKRQLLTPYIVSEQLIDKVINQNLGFEHFKLSNNSQNMTRVKMRIQWLENNSKIESNEVTINGVRIFQNMEANRLQLFFPDKPSSEIREQLKHRGFRWSPREGAWQRHVSNTATHYAKEIVSQIKNDLS